MSLHTIGRELKAKLAAKGCPFEVYDRERAAPTAWHHGKIVLEEGDDTFGTPRTLSINPKRWYTATSTVKVRIYARSTQPGAQEFEHRTVAKAVRDLVLVAFRYIAAERKIDFTPQSGGFRVPKDLEKSDAQGGAVYELTFSFTEGVHELDWKREKNPEGLIAGFASTSLVSLANGPDDDGNSITPPLTAETACGGPPPDP